MWYIGNEQRSVHFITLVLYLCLFFYCPKCEVVDACDV